MTAFEEAWQGLLAGKSICHGQLVPPSQLGAVDRQLWQTYATFLSSSRDPPVVVAHLGASLDGRIATETGHSSWVTGQADLAHMHRLRALADGVVIGPGTAACDDPLLTVRLVDGPSPRRVILDPRGTLSTELRVFKDTPPTTLWLRGIECGRVERMRAVEVVALPTRDGRFAAGDVIAIAREQGMQRILIEGGGQTVSTFISAGYVDFLHYCIAPVLIGSGRPAMTLPAIQTMQQALRLDPVIVPLGTDLLYVCPLPRHG